MPPFERLGIYLLVGSNCLASLVDGQIQKKPPVWKTPQSWPLNKGISITKFSGSDVQLNCSTYGYPKPKTTWFKDGDMFHEKLRHKTKARNGYLRLKVLQKSDTGNYTCLVQNSEGSLNFTFRLNVVEISLLVLVDNPRRVTVLEGDRVVLRCMALGDSDANIHWEKMDDSIVDPETHSRDFLPCNDPEIVFEKVQVSDAGKYTCTIEYSTTYSIEVKSAVFLLTVNKDRIVTKAKPAVSMITPKPIFTDPKMNGLDDEEFFGSGVDENYDDGILRPRVINTLSNFNYSEEKDQFLLNNNNSIQDSPAGKPPHTDEEGLMKARTIDVILGVVAGVALLVGLVAIVAILYRYRLRSLTVTE